MGYQNFFATKLFTDIGAADTTITLETAPTATSGRLVLEARNATQKEIIKYTGVSANQITGVTRGQGGTTAKSHIKNSLVEMNATAEDLQDLYDAFNSFAAANNDWKLLPYTPNLVTYLGNRSYQETFTGVDLTSILSPGMRQRTTRTVPAPTQSPSLNGTTQSFTKTAPAGMAFTDNFTICAWIKPTAFQSAFILSREDATRSNGYQMSLNSTTGQLQIGAATGGTARLGTTVQSVTLNKWIHVVGTMTAATGTVNTYFDGVAVPNSVGGSVTALVQAGNLFVGQAANAGSFFPGKIAQVSVHSAVLTPTQVKAIYSQGMTAADVATYNVVSAFSLSGASGLTDINTTNANNLTANGGAVTTNADSFSGTQASGLISSTLDHAIYQDVQFTGGNTVAVVQVAEGCTIPTNSGGVSAVSYSGLGKPYGFPSQERKWTIFSNYIFVTLGGVTGTWYSGLTTGSGHTVLNVPLGEWTIDYVGFLYSDSGAAITMDKVATLSTSATVPTDIRMMAWATVGTTNANTYNRSFLSKSGDFSPTVMTPYYVLAQSTGGAGNHQWSVQGGYFGLIIKAKNTWL